MANGDEGDGSDNGEVEYEFVCNDDSCEICQSLSGTTSSELLAAPHENCRCSVLLRNRKGCEYTYEIASAGNTRRYGPNGECFIWVAEVEVTCHNGSVIGGSVEIDMGCDNDGLDMDGLVAKAWGEAYDAAASMANGCPDCEFLCC